MSFPFSDGGELLACEFFCGTFLFPQTSFPFGSND